MSSKAGQEEGQEGARPEGTRLRDRHSRQSVGEPKAEESGGQDAGADKDKSHPAATKSSAPVLGKEERKNEDSSSGPIKGDRSSTEKELTGKKGSYGHGPDKVKEKEKHCPILHPPTPTPARASLTGEPKVIKKGDQVITSYVDEKTGKITVYEPGIKLEVSDFAGNWYPARVVDVDAEDQEILVHFENWSARFDEWIKMDSNRIRPSPNTNVVKTQFKVGEQVEALWSKDGQRYPGVIQSILPNDTFQVLFDDGIKLKKKYNQIFKLKPVTRNIARSSEGPPQAQNSQKLSRPLPELTPISHLISTASKSAISPSMASSPPPPLLPKPKLKPIKNPSKGPGPGRPPKKLNPSPPPPVLIPQTELVAPYTNVNVFTQVEKDLGKRKRTVHDYSALLKTTVRAPSDLGDTSVGTQKRRTRKRLSLESEETVETLSLEADSPEKVPPPLTPQATPEPEAPKSKGRPRNSGTTPRKVRTIVVSQTSPLSSKSIVKEAEIEEIGKEKKEEAGGQVEEEAPTTATEEKLPVPTKRSRKATEKALALIASTEDEEYTPNRRLQRRTTLTRRKPGPVRKRSTDTDYKPPSKSKVSSPPEPESESASLKPPASDASTEGSVGLTKSKSREESMEMDASLIDPTPAEVPEPTSSVSPSAGLEKMETESGDISGSEVALEEKKTPEAVAVVDDKPMSSRSRPRRKPNRLTFSSESLNTRTRTPRPKPIVEVKEVTPVPAPAPTPPPPAPEPSPSEEAPLSKRKRTIHDYSMLLKTRPKFFFDIEEETKRPNRAGRKKREKRPSEAELDSSIPAPDEGLAENLPVTFEDEKPNDESSGKRVTTRTEGEVESNTEDVVASNSNMRSGRRSSGSLALTSSKRGSLSAEGIQLVSTRTSESNETNGASLILPPGSKSESTNSTAQARLSVSTRRQSAKIQAEVQKDAGKSGNQNSLDKTNSLLGSELSSISVPTSDDEELLDIDNSFHETAAPPSEPNDPNAKLDTQPIPVTRTAPKRPANMRWWRKKSANALKRQKALLAGSAISKSKRKVPPPKQPQKPGDILSGLSSGRIRNIRKNLAETGVEKYVSGEPAFREVSVDIINCWCGVTDEHGLMIQCEFCLCWQHGHCYGFEEVDEMPPHYVCASCQCPENLRPTMDTDWNYPFHKLGRLPSLRDGPELDPEKKRLFAETNDLMARALQVREIIHSTRINLQIMNSKPDHKKLYQWDKPHKTIKEENQELRFNKSFRPLLRRLLYINRDDPTYPEKLRKKVETMLQDRKFGPKVKTEDKEKMKVRVSQPFIPLTKCDAVPKPDSSKQTKEIECVDLTENTKSVEEEDSSPLPKVEVKEEPTVSAEEAAEISALMSKMLSDLEGGVESVLLPLPETSEPHAKDILSTSAGIEVDEGGISSPDLLMNLDPSDPKFNTMAEDLVKSCCEEPEGLIKTLEDLAQQNDTATSLAMGTSDSDLLNFLDDDFMHSLDPGFDSNSNSKVSEDGKPSSTSLQHLVTPVAPTLTRITPELCRENLTLTILDQQKVVDERLDEIEAKIVEMERAKGIPVPNTVSHTKRVERLHRKVHRVLSNLSLMKKIGQQAACVLDKKRKEAMGISMKSEKSDEETDSDEEESDQELDEDEYAEEDFEDEDEEDEDGDEDEYLDEEEEDDSYYYDEEDEEDEDEDDDEYENEEREEAFLDSD